MPVSCFWVPSAGAVIDALIPPEEGIGAFRDRPPERVLLSNRHHLRHAERFADQFGCTIHCSKPGLHEFEGGPAVEGFDFGEEVAPGIEGLEVGAICPDESALLIRDAGALVIADGIVHYRKDLGSSRTRCSVTIRKASRPDSAPPIRASSIATSTTSSSPTGIR